MHVCEFSLKRVGGSFPPPLREADPQPHVRLWGNIPGCSPNSLCNRRAGPFRVQRVGLL